LVDDNSVLNYCLYIIAAIITPVMSMVNPFITYAVYEQDSYSCTRCFDVSNSILISEIENGNSLDSYFHYTGLFSDLSRNMTSPSPPPASSSSSDLFEDSNVNTELQDNVDTEVNGLQEEDTTDTNQTSPSSSSDLFEDSNVNTELQDNAENNNTEIDQQDESTTATELQENNDNNATSG
jgi:hypothetical protein